MTPGEREQKIISMMQRICIMSMTGNLFEKKGLKRLQESLEILNELPVDKEKYSRLNSCHSFLQEMNEEYLQKTIVFFEEKNKAI